MKNRVRARRTAGAIGGVLASLVIAGTALGFECTNISKSDPAAGAQLLIGPGDEIVWVTPGLARRLELGLVGPNGEGFHGIVAIDFDGDGIADVSTYIGVGPDGEIPLNAQLAGPACRGMTNLGIVFEQCLGA
jgi:hypothetical protein